MEVTAIAHNMEPFKARYETRNEFVECNGKMNESLVRYLLIRVQYMLCLLDLIVATIFYVSSASLSLCQGQRLGSVDEAAKHRSSPPTAPSMNREDDEVPAPVVNPNLTNEEREKIRAARAAAAEARLKKQNPAGKKKTTTNTSAAPLNGPNSQPLMRWN